MNGFIPISAFLFGASFAAIGLNSLTVFGRFAGRRLILQNIIIIQQHQFVSKHVGSVKITIYKVLNLTLIRKR